MDGATIELAKPVIGTREPAPANFPILLNKFKPVKKALTAISIIDTTVPELASSSPRSLHIVNMIWPIVQINPPTRKA